MKKIILAAAITAVVATTTGCVSTQPKVDVAKKTQVTLHQKTIGAVELSPVDTADKLYYIEVKSQAQHDFKSAQLASKVEAALADRGWKKAEPSRAKLAVSVVIESLEQTLYNQEQSNGVKGAVAGGVAGAVLGGDAKGALIGGVLGFGLDKLMNSASNDDQDIYWQMNTRVSFRTKDGIDLNQISSIDANNATEYGTAMDQRRASRMSRTEEARLERLKQLEEMRLRQSMRGGKSSAEVKKPSTEWSNPALVKFVHTANKANLTFDEAMPELEKAFVNSISGIL